MDLDSILVHMNAQKNQYSINIQPISSHLDLILGQKPIFQVHDYQEVKLLIPNQPIAKKKDTTVQGQEKKVLIIRYIYS